MIDRSISFEGVPNCRTLGGLPAAGGRRVADGRLFRSALLAAAAPEDLRRLREELGVTLVVDLRTSWEREEKPDREVPGAAFLARPVFDDPKPGVSHEEKLEQGPPPIPDMADVYRLMVSEEKCRFIIVSGYQEFEYIRSALRAGVVDYLLKPLSAADLSAALARLLQGKEEGHLGVKTGKGFYDYTK